MFEAVSTDVFVACCLLKERQVMQMRKYMQILRPIPEQLRSLWIYYRLS
jgi:hypothetical protein